MDGRDVDGTAAGRRLADALRAQASFASGPAAAHPHPTPPHSGDARAAVPRHGAPVHRYQDARAGFGGEASGALPTVVGPRASAGASRARPPAADGGRWSGPAEVAARVRLALLVAFLVGTLLGGALATLSVLLPGLLPALG